MRFGNSSPGVSFSSDGGNDREALEKVIRKVYREEIPEDTPFVQTVGIVNVSIVPMNWLQHFYPWHGPTTPYSVPFPTKYSVSFMINVNTDIE